MKSGGVENFPQGYEGKTRDIVAEKLNIGSVSDLNEIFPTGKEIFLLIN